jgi:uncharacterized membrane protein
VLHFGATVFCVLGAFQFVPALRRRRPRWHRLAGRLLVPCGLAAALSGLWMTLFYDLPPGDGDLLTVFRLCFGTAMAVSIVLATAAIRRRDVRRHRVWMTRGYAIGLGAGTQVLTHVPWTLLVGVPGEVTRAMLMAAGWVINLVVAEWALRRRKPVRADAKPAVPLGRRAFMLPRTSPSAKEPTHRPVTGTSREPVSPPARCPRVLPQPTAGSRIS